MDPRGTNLVDRAVEAVTLAAGTIVTVLGLWAYVGPESFASFADFPHHAHFVHDLAAYQLGIGAALLLAVIWSDALVTVLAGFLLANTAHALNHIVDLDDGGHVWQIWALIVLSLAAAAALWLRLRAVDYVVGTTAAATEQSLLPYVRRRTAVALSDDEGGGVSMTIAVVGDLVYASCFESSVRAEWGDDARVRIAPAPRGHPVDAPLPTRIRRLDGPDVQRATRPLRRKYPLLHGVLLPLAPRFGPSKEDDNAYFVLELDDDPL